MDFSQGGPSECRRLLPVVCATGLTRSRLLSYVKSRVGTDTVDCVTGQYLGIGAGESRGRICSAGFARSGFPGGRRRRLRRSPDRRRNLRRAGQRTGGSHAISRSAGRGPRRRHLPAISPATVRRCAFRRGRRGFLCQSCPRIPRDAPALRAQVAGQDLYPWTQRQEPGHAHRLSLALLKQRASPNHRLAPPFPLFRVLAGPTICHPAGDVSS
jgi:hypothetical protein